MTALERRWVESEWWKGILGSWIRYAGPGVIIDCSFDFPHGPQAALWIKGDVFEGPHVATFEAAKSDAEAMYRQWVYDEYGAVLP
jgi:hypothetical protein